MQDIDGSHVQYRSQCIEGRSKNAARHSLEAVSANPDDTTKPLQLGNIQCHIHFALSGRIAINQTTPKLLL